MSCLASCSIGHVWWSHEIGLIGRSSLFWPQLLKLLTMSNWSESVYHWLDNFCAVVVWRIDSFSHQKCLVLVWSVFTPFHFQISHFLYLVGIGELLLFTLLRNEMYAGSNSGRIECFWPKAQPFVAAIFRTNNTWPNLANRNLLGVNQWDCALAICCLDTSYSFIHGVTICC